MKHLKISILLLLGMVLPASLHAAVIDVNGAAPIGLPSVLGNPSNEEAYVESTWAGGADLTFLQKWNTDGTGFSETPGIGTYTFDSSGNVATSTVTWDLTGTGFSLTHILLKNGRLPRQGAFLYNLYAIGDGMDVTGSGSLTIDGSKGISHYTFFGVPGGGTTVPDGGNTILLLGCALGFLVLFQRRLALA